MIYGPVWSPDSKRIAFWDRGGELMAYVVNTRWHGTLNPDQEQFHTWT